MPRYEIQIAASIPHSEDVVSPIQLTALLDEFEARLQELGAVVTIQLARTTSKDRPDKSGTLEDYLLKGLASKQDAGSTGQYL